jgi:hypothetical protein
VVGEIRDSQIIMNLLVTNVPGCTGSNAKILGLQYLQFLDVEAGSGPPDRTRIVHHGTDELLIQQNAISEGKTASPISERSQRSQPLRRFFSHLIEMFQPGQPFIEVRPEITGVIDLFDWLPEELYCSGFRDALTGLGEEHGGALRR